VRFAEGGCVMTRARVQVVYHPHSASVSYNRNFNKHVQAQPLSNKKGKKAATTTSTSPAHSDDAQRRAAEAPPSGAQQRGASTGNTAASESTR
jgi:metal-dependent amidase/aminoacylase/carboxypeptidase family protein